MMRSIALSLFHCPASRPVPGSFTNGYSNLLRGRDVSQEGSAARRNRLWASNRKARSRTQLHPKWVVINFRV